MANSISSFLTSKLRSLRVTDSSKANRTRRSRTQSPDNTTTHKLCRGGEVEIEVDRLTDQPSLAWERLSRLHTSQELTPDHYLLKPRDEESVLRFVCISDTHGVAEQKRRQFHQRVPDGDVLIHCGDFTMGGDPSEVSTFDNFMSKLPHPVKLVIAGNHEMTFEPGACYGVHPTLVRKQLGLEDSASSRQVASACKDLLQSCLYLEDESISICGLNLYGSPWVPEFGSWGFSIKRGPQLLKKWNEIPSNTDILITHGPPLGYGDEVSGGNRAGCAELLNTVVHRVRPKFHVFGHIHTGYGMWTNGRTTFINASTCSDRYSPDHDPIVFDCPLPSGYSRADFLRLSTESLRHTRDQAVA